MIYNRIHSSHCTREKFLSGKVPSKIFPRFINSSQMFVMKHHLKYLLYLRPLKYNRPRSKPSVAVLDFEARGYQAMKQKRLPNASNRNATTKAIQTCRPQTSQSSLEEPSAAVWMYTDECAAEVRTRVRRQYIHQWRCGKN
jgi:hypothetical protein